MEMNGVFLAFGVWVASGLHLGLALMLFVLDLAHLKCLCSTDVIVDASGIYRDTESEWWLTGRMPLHSAQV